MPTEVIQPPPIRPMLTPTANIEEMMPMAMGTFFGGKVSRTMPKARVNMPIPIPCRARKNSRTNMDVVPNSAFDMVMEKPPPSSAIR